ncbi:MAG: alpha/beta fold hydrolase [Deltaproteobacteria bacterium]|nr:alpha/beta fold hydrolase [Deltaproteobacteria bacterium]
MSGKTSKTLTFAAFLFFLTFNAGCGSFFFSAKKEFTVDTALEAYDYRDVYFPSYDGTRLNGYFFKGRGDKKGAVLFLHGYSENISTQARVILWLVDAGYDVFIFDYRGHGRSEGDPSIGSVHGDAAAALDELMNMKDADLDKGVFVFGQSMGGSIAVYTVAASKHKGAVKALILDAPFASFQRIAKERSFTTYKTRLLSYLVFLVDDSHNAIDWIGRVAPVPVLIAHGDKDEIVDIAHAYSLYEKALDPKELWVVKDKGHARIFEDADMRRRLLFYMDGKK